MNFSDTSYYKSLPEEEKLFSKRIVDWINFVHEKNSEKFSFFLDESQCSFAEDILHFFKIDNYSFFGGYKEAKRKLLGVFPYFESVDNEEFPLKPILISFSNFRIMTHRDILGSLMSLQIKREMIGDIIINENKAVVFLYTTIYSFVFNNIEKIGNVRVKISDDISGFNFSVEQEFIDISGTASSLRLDCIVSFITKLSREKSSALIKSSFVAINSKNVDDSSHILNVSDIISIRKYGKFIFSSINGKTKKDKYYIIIKKYV